MYASIQIVHMCGCFPSFHISKNHPAFRSTGKTLDNHAASSWTIDGFYPHMTSPESVFCSIQFHRLEDTASYIMCLWLPSDCSKFKGHQNPIDRESSARCNNDSFLPTFSMFSNSSSFTIWSFCKMWFRTATGCSSNCFQSFSFKPSGLWRCLTPNSTSSWVS